MSQLDTQNVQTAQSEEIQKSRYDPSKNLTNAGKGRKPGTKNKLSKSAKDVIEKTFVKMGDVNGLYEWSIKNEKNRTAFYTIIWPKIIPRNIDLQASFTVDIGARLLAARSLQSKIEAAKEMKLIEINNQGKVIEEAVKQSVIEAIEEEEKKSHG